MKHKISLFHRCNHHLPVWFEDSQKECQFTRTISIENLVIESPTGILVPKLIYFLEKVIQCYNKLDSLFEEAPDKFTAICEKYDGSSF